MKRYVVFFMAHYRAFQVREVTFEDTARTVPVPIDTFLFFFIQSELDLETVRSIFYASEAFELETSIERSFALPVENETLYFIGKRDNDVIDNTWARVKSSWSVVSKWRGNVEVIDRDRLNLKRMTIHFKGKGKYFSAHRNGREYSIELSFDGMIYTRSWDEGEKNRRFNLWEENLEEILSDIKVVGEEHPEVYQEILTRIEDAEKEHEYYRLMAEFCREEISKG